MSTETHQEGVDTTSLIVIRMYTAVSYIVRMGATRSREAMRIPSSAISAVSSRAQVGSPLAFPWPNTWQTHGVRESENIEFKEQFTHKKRNHSLSITPEC